MVDWKHKLKQPHLEVMFYVLILVNANKFIQSIGISNFKLQNMLFVKNNL